MAGRAVTVLPDDTFIVSYPRSGNTWARFLISHLLRTSQSPTDFLNIEKRIPDIYQNADAFLKKLPSPRLLKSHEYFDPRYKKVIYIARNPINVAVSYYYYMIKIRKISDNYPIEEFIARFLVGSLDPFGTWDEHVGSWLGARRGNKNFLLILYETLQEDTERILRTVARFLNVEMTDDHLSRAISLGSAERMLELEKTQAHQWRPLRGSRSDINFIRSAPSGNRLETVEISDYVAATIKARWSYRMKDLGY